MDADSSLVLTPTHVKQLGRVQSVVKEISLGTLTITAACEKLGIPRATFYDNINRPEIASEVNAQILARKHITNEFLERNWTLFLYWLRDVAADEGHPRERVQAIKVLKDIADDLERTMRVDEAQDGPSEAAILLQRAREMPKTVRAVRTTVKEELEFLGD